MPRSTLMRTRVVSNRWLGVIAVAIALSFFVGLYANSFLLGTQSSKGIDQDGFIFSEDVVAVTVTHLGQVVFHADYPNIITNAGEDLISAQTSCGAKLPPAVTTTTSSTTASSSSTSTTTSTSTTSSTSTTTTTATTTSATTVVCGYGGVFIALSNSTATPLATDTTCPSELTTNGLARTLGTYTHTIGTNTQTITASFIYTTSAYSTAVTKVCMFNAQTGGDLFAESLLTPSATVSAVGDNVTIQWTFTH